MIMLCGNAATVPSVADLISRASDPARAHLSMDNIFADLILLVDDTFTSIAAATNFMNDASTQCCITLFTHSLPAVADHGDVPGAWFTYDAVQPIFRAMSVTGNRVVVSALEQVMAGVTNMLDTATTVVNEISHCATAHGSTLESWNNDALTTTLMDSNHAQHAFVTFSCVQLLQVEFRKLAGTMHRAGHAVDMTLVDSRFKTLWGA